MEEKSLRVGHDHLKFTTADENGLQPTKWAKESSPGQSRDLGPCGALGQQIGNNSPRIDVGGFPTPTRGENLGKYGLSARSMAAGGARRHLACRLPLFVRCALGFFPMALQAIFMKALHAPDGGATYDENPLRRRGRRFSARGGFESEFHNFQPTPADLRSTTPPGEGIFMKVPHDLFKLTTADENDGLRESVGADLRAATNLTRAFTATERGDHLQARIFIEALRQGIHFLFGATILLGLLQPAMANIGAGAVVLVNSQAMDFPEFRQVLEPYLIQFGVPYSVQDISQKPLGRDLQDYALVIIGHRGFDVPRRFLNLQSEQLLLEAIQHGTGLVSFDGLLVAWQNDKPQQPYRFIEEIFNFDHQSPVMAESITIGSPTGSGGGQQSVHFITNERSTPRDIKLKTPLKVPGFRVRERGEVLASAGGQPVLVGGVYGEGNVVLFSTIEWGRPDVKGKIYGLDDLIWRSLVWAARKPFVIRGMPRFLAFRVDDVSGFGKESNQHLGWIAPAIKYGLKPWLGLFIDDLKEDPEALTQLSRLTQQGQATASVHARRWRDFFYLDEPLWTDLQGRNVAGRPWPNDTIDSNFAEGEAFFARHGIVKSKVVIPHLCEFTVNDFKGLTNWGCEFVGVLLQPGQGWGMSTVPAGPYLPSEPPRPTNSIDPVYIADWLTVPDHPEYEHRFFNFVVEVHDVAGYEWAPSGVPVKEAIRRGVEETRREWDSLLPGVLFTHESDHIRHLTPQDWDQILKGVMEGLQDYHPIPVTLDYLSQYLRALKTSKIGAANYNSSSNEIEVECDGETDLPTRFWVFSLDRGQITRQELEIEAFQGKTWFKRPVVSRSAADPAEIVR